MASIEIILAGRPGTTINDSLYGAMGNPMKSSEKSLATRAAGRNMSNDGYGLRVERGVEMGGPPVTSSTNVLFRCEIAKVVQMVVSAIPVDMVNLHSFWTWANKGQHYKTMDSEPKSHPVVLEPDSMVAALISTCSEKSPFTRKWLPVFSHGDAIV